MDAEDKLPFGIRQAAAYFGDPAAANAEEGAATVAELGRILAEAVRAALDPGRAG